MGFNLAVLAISDHGSLDLQEQLPEDGGRIVQALFPRTKYAVQEQRSLGTGRFPERGEIWVGMFERGLLLSTRDAHLYNPSKLAARYLKPALGRTVTLITQRSVNDMFAYGNWSDGELTRSLSVNPVGRVWESIGEPEAWEAQYWRGDHPVADDYPLPFHPLDMSDTAIRTKLRLLYEGPWEPGLIDPSSIILHIHRRDGTSAARA